MNEKQTHTEALANTGRSYRLLLLTDWRAPPTLGVKDQSTVMRLVMPLLEVKEQGRVTSSPRTASISGGPLTFTDDTEDNTGLGKETDRDKRLKQK